MTYPFADPCELYLSGGTYHGPAIASSGSSFAIGDRVSGGYQDFELRSVLDAAGEGMRLEAISNTTTAGTDQLGLGVEELYVMWTQEWSDATPAVVTNVFFQIVGSTFFNDWTGRLSTAGKATLYNGITGAATLQQTGARTHADATRYCFLLGLNATAGTIKLWIGALDGSGEWADPTNFDAGNEDFSHTDATQNGTISRVNIGWHSIGKTNPASTSLIKGIVWSTTKPTKRLWAWYHAADDSQTSDYEGGTTNWTNESAAAATPASVDDANAQADDDTTFVVAEAGVAADSRFSNYVLPCATVGIPSDHNVVAAFSLHRVRKENAGSDTTTLETFTRYGGVNGDLGNAAGVTTTGYFQKWTPITAGPSGEALSQTLVDGMQLGLIRRGTSTDPGSGTRGHRCTQAGLIVVTEKADAVAVTRRRMGQAV